MKRNERNKSARNSDGGTKKRVAGSKGRRKGRGRECRTQVGVGFVCNARAAKAGSAPSFLPPPQ